MSIEYFYSLTPRQFFNISKGYKKKQDSEKRLSWEQTRAVMYTIHLSTPTMKKKKKVSLQEFLPFEWEQEAESKKQTTEELEAMFKKWDKVDFNKQYQ